MKESLYMAKSSQSRRVFDALDSYFKSSLVSIDDMPQDIHLEYFPMVNARAHNIGGGKGNKILNVNLRDTYN